MPLIHIHLVKGKSPKYIQAVCDGIHNALKAAWRIPENDRFQIVSEHKKEHFYFDKTIWGVKRSNDLILIYITSISRSVAQKKKLYKEFVTVLGKNPKVRKEDIFCSIVTIGREDWSFGNGVAQLTQGTNMKLLL
ncbi:MAG: tautomerase family protein [Verrucomicrobiota bacterium]|jgi:4-oxalocrotonate tautomerase